VALISACEFGNGTAIRPCRVAYRTFGRLNAAQDNVVLIPTWLLGRSEDWNASGLLGPEALVDTTEFYTVIVDALGNGHSQSPSNSDAALRGAFDSLTIADMVRSQHRLLTEHLQIPRLHAVVGASMGGMQAFEWAVRFPDFVDLIVPIIGSPRIGAFDFLLWSHLQSIIDDGLRGQLPARAIWLQVAQVVLLFSRTPLAVNQAAPVDIERRVASAAASFESNWTLADFRAQLGAMIRHDVSHDLSGDLQAAARRIRSRSLMVYSWDDHMVTAGAGAAFGRMINADSTVVPSRHGHRMFMSEPEKFYPAVRAFLRQ
jgi:homoserine O-acetyltransferase/O-succinyltransferase